MTAEEMHEIEEGRREMTVKEAVELIDNRMCFGRGKWSEHHTPTRDIYWIAGEMAIKALKSKLEWIPFTRRPLTEEEKEDRPDLDFILDCDLPEDYQKILITVDYKGHENVQFDTFYFDPDGCDLDSGYAICDEAVAWMPLPEPYRKGEEENEQQN